MPGHAEDKSDRELARRSLIGFGEIAAVLGDHAAGSTSVFRRPSLVGARIDAAAANPWFSAAVVPLGMTPPDDDPSLPTGVWVLDGSVPGRGEDIEIATPVMGMALAERPPATHGMQIERVTLATIGDLNEAAYGDFGTFGTLVRAIADPRVRTYGFRDGDSVVCAGLTLAVGDDVGIHFLATTETHRRRGLGASLIEAMLADAHRAGCVTATLQASSDGLSLYERMGFRQVGTMKGWVRPATE